MKSSEEHSSAETKAWFENSKLLAAIGVILLLAGYFVLGTKQNSMVTIGGKTTSLTPEQTLALLAPYSSQQEIEKLEQQKSNHQLRKATRFFCWLAGFGFLIWAGVKAFEAKPGSLGRANQAESNDLTP